MPSSVRALAALLAACGSVPAPSSCRWGTGEAFYLGDDATCRDVVAADPGDGSSCIAWSERGTASRSAWSGASTLRVWLDTTYGVRAQPTGVAACVAAQTLATAPYATELAVAWTGEMYEVVWSQPEGTFLVRVDEATWGFRAPERIAEPATRFAWLAGLGRRVLVRQRDGTPGAVRLYDDQLREHGAIDPGSDGALVDAVMAGDRLAVVWSATGSAPGGALVYDLPGGLGAPVVDAPALSESQMQEPHVAWVGDRFLVAWWEIADVASIWGATVDAGGQLVGGRALLAAQGSAPRLAAAGASALMLYAVHDSPSFCYGELRATSVDAVQLSSSAPFTLGSSGRGTLSEYAAVPVGAASFEAAGVARTYAPGEATVLTTCASPVFVGVDAGGVRYTDVLGTPFR